MRNDKSDNSVDGPEASNQLSANSSAGDKTQEEETESTCAAHCVGSWANYLASVNLQFPYKKNIIIVSLSWLCYSNYLG